MLFAPFDWLYRRLGSRYPKIFVTLELQAGFLVTAGTVVLLAVYYDGSLSDYALLMAIALGLTACSIAFGLIRIYPRLDPITDWIGGRRDEESTERAWVEAVSLPLALVRDELLIPLIGVVLPSIIAALLIFDLPWVGFFPLLGAGIVAAGYGAILHHLTLEIAMRPVLVDLNRAVPPSLASHVTALSLRWRLLAVLPMINVITGLAVAAVSGADNLGVAVLAAIGVATTISLELTILLTRSVMQPLRDLQRATDSVIEGDFDAAVAVTTGDEIGELAASFNQMVSGLRERERIRQAFGTYLDHEVAEHILSEGFSEQGELVEVSILFCDVKDFSGFAETAEAKEVVACLNQLFGVVVPVIAAEGGHVDKFEGDGLLAVFGAPQPFSDHADRAVRAAFEIDRLVNRVGEGGDFKVGIGVNTGQVVAGSVGGGGRLNFSVIGDAVNVASRVEDATRSVGDDVLITAAARERLHEDFGLERRGERELRGLERPVTLYALPSEGGEGLLEPVGGAVRAVYARVRGHRPEG
ncbi:MAG: adenylate/guanylate cyclase domain-containing protein [Solirubrobacterales bacterium]|nr:adenylate/guanylate cyclase domain-containing protein [Solirubrobacterales bacterium]